jgi:biopolymer transport protein ExbD
LDIKVDLPAASATPAKKTDNPVYLTLGADLSLSVGETQVTTDTLVAELQRATGEQQDRRIFLRADRTVDYGNLMATLDQLREAGYLKVALVAKEGAQKSAQEDGRGE